MSAPRKVHAIQLVKIQPEERIAPASELNLAPSSVTNCREAKGMGCWAATQVKGLSSEIIIVSVVDTVHIVEDRILITAKRGYASPTESETVARYQKDSMGTRETHGILHKGGTN